MQDQGIFNRFFFFLNSHPCFDAFKVSRAVELGILKSLEERVRDRSYPVRSSTQSSAGTNAVSISKRMVCTCSEVVVQSRGGSRNGGYHKQS